MRSQFLFCFSLSFVHKVDVIAARYSSATVNKIESWNFELKPPAIIHTALLRARWRSRAGVFNRFSALHVNIPNDSPRSRTPSTSWNSIRRDKQAIGIMSRLSRNLIVDMLLLLPLLWHSVWEKNMFPYMSVGKHLLRPSAIHLSITML